jgi:hypothetical protein
MTRKYYETDLMEWRVILMDSAGPVQVPAEGSCEHKVKVKITLLQAMEAHRVARG